MRAIDKFRKFCKENPMTATKIGASRVLEQYDAAMDVCVLAASITANSWRRGTSLTGWEEDVLNEVINRIKTMGKKRLLEKPTT